MGRYEFKKYAENRKRVEQGLRKMEQKAIRDRQKTARKREADRQKNIRARKKMSEANKTVRQSETQFNPVLGVLILLAMGVIGAVIIDIILDIGIGAFFIVVVAIIVVCVIILFVKGWIEVGKDENQNLYMKTLLLNYERYKRAAKEAETVDARKMAESLIIAVISELLSFNDRTLKKSSLSRDMLEREKRVLEEKEGYSKR